MSEQDARDPYLGINNLIRDRARAERLPYYAVGKILSLKPLTVRSMGMNLDKNDLKISQHLCAGWVENLSGLTWPLTADLPNRTLSGQCSCALGAGTVEVWRPAETLDGRTTDTATATHPLPLQPGDEVLMILSEDGQTYYMIEKLVGVSM